MRAISASQSRKFAGSVHGLGTRGLGVRRQQQPETHSDPKATELPGEAENFRHLPPSANLKEQLLLSYYELADQPESEAVMTNWVTEACKILKHNGEPPLFTKQLLSPRKDEQRSSLPSSQMSGSERNWTISASDGQLFYRPERTHKYLHASVYGSTVFDLTEKDRPHNQATEIQLGRPTRSSLLRARYCSLSTFSDQYSRENKRRPCDFSAIRCHQHMEALKRAPHSSGENVRSFLIGARYNSTNYLDSKAVEKHGLFVCRNKPHVHFMADHGKGQSKKIHTEAVSTLLEEPIVCFKQTTSATYVSESDDPPAPEVDRLNNKVRVPWGISTKKANDEIHMSNEDSALGKLKSALIERCVFHSTAQKMKKNREWKTGRKKNPAEMLITKLCTTSKALIAPSSQTCKTISVMPVLPNQMHNRRIVCYHTDQKNTPSLLVKSMKPLHTYLVPPLAPPSSRGSSQRSSITQEICEEVGTGGPLSAQKSPINLSANDDGSTEEKYAGY
ncbi:uncharacterized protein LOC119976738 isoform X2 [Scyliorhinus canicula]|uniref:uncharacterized protein LOC119976738 isoform X2 n=1 Tax=Scyliorhinus canicula TaxID=7830 RepID=UPI0018F64AE3|nr:uncharacterized protein LOC119976738 isoform X2 [Scyliorhinus canicula]